mgnify:CR=1 FL=1
MLTLMMEELDDDGRMIVQDVCIRMLKRMAVELKAAKKEVKEAAKKKADGEEGRRQSERGGSDS